MFKAYIRAVLRAVLFSTLETDEQPKQIFHVGTDPSFPQNCDKMPGDHPLDIFFQVIFREA